MPAVLIFILALRLSASLAAPPAKSNKKKKGKSEKISTPSPSPSAFPSPQKEASETLPPGPPFVVVSAAKQATKVAGLKILPAEENDLKIERSGDDLTVTAVLRGVYEKPAWSLLALQKHLNVTGKKFELSVPLKGQNTDFKFDAIGPKGEIEDEILTIRVEEWEQRIKKFKASSSKRLSFSTMAGLTFQTFEQTTKRTRITVNGFAATVKISLNYIIFPPHFELGTNFFMNVLPLSSTNSEIKDLRVLGANVRVGYVLPFISEPWKVGLHVGLGYTTTLTARKIGIRGLIWPQIYPTLRRTFKGGHSANMYFKYSSLGDGSGLAAIFSLDQRELAIGGGWSKLLPNNHPILVGFDYSSIVVKPVSTSKLAASSWTLSGGYGW